MTFIAAFHIYHFVYNFVLLLSDECTIMEINEHGAFLILSYFYIELYKILNII